MNKSERTSNNRNIDPTESFLLLIQNIWIMSRRNFTDTVFSTAQSLKVRLIWMVRQSLVKARISM